VRKSVLNHSANLATTPDLTMKATSAGIVAALIDGNPDQVIAQGTVRAEGRAAAQSERPGRLPAD
jgi:hypothetical protein